MTQSGQPIAATNMQHRLHLHGAGCRGFAWLSSPGASAISILWLEGVSVELPYPHELWIIGQGGEVLDQAMACPVAGGVLVTCHGGAAVRQAVESALAKSGSVPHQFEPFGHSRLEKLTLALLPRAQGAAAVNVLLEAASQGNALAQLHAEEVPRLLADSASSRFLFDPPRVQLWGPVNAGKSSLLNALCGLQLAATGAEPGLTRDVLEGRCEHEGFVIRVFDAPGEMQGGSELDQAAQEHARQWRDQAGMVLNVSASPRQVCGPGFALPYEVGDAASIAAIKARLVACFYDTLRALPPNRRFALHPDLRADLANLPPEEVRTKWSRP